MLGEDPERILPCRRFPRRTHRPLPGREARPRLPNPNPFQTRSAQVGIAERRAFSCRGGSLSASLESSPCLADDGRRRLRRSHRRTRTETTVTASTFRTSIPTEFRNMLSVALHTAQAPSDRQVRPDFATPDRDTLQRASSAPHALPRNTPRSTGKAKTADRISTIMITVGDNSPGLSW